MTIQTIFAAVVLAASLTLTPVQAAQEHEGYDLIFRTGTLDSFAPGDVLRYRTAHDGLDPRQEGAEGTLSLTLEEDGQVQLRRSAAETMRPVASFKAASGNPMAMYFLESLVRDVAAATGGSPFYIRNRIKDALLAPRGITGDGGAAQVVTLAPFAEDDHAAQLGVFADLQVSVTVSPEAPGWYLDLRAEAPGAPGYLSAITFEGAGQ